VLCCWWWWSWIWYGFNQSSERLHIRNINTWKLKSIISSIIQKNLMKLKD
jgi:hypothetical protein